MVTEDDSNPESQLHAANYCMGFLDLLGQREAAKDQQLLPIIADENDRKAFVLVVKRTIGSIMTLQKSAKDMFDELVMTRLDSPLRAALPYEQKLLWDRLHQSNLEYQRWSDGITFFTKLGDSEIECPMHGVYGVIGMCGSQCLLALALGKPLRGAIDLAWGIEIEPGELYGPIVARAYELESEVAGYPRIVVGRHVHEYLNFQRNRTDGGLTAELNRSMAELCLDLVIRDHDGQFVVHYLGRAFREAITTNSHAALYTQARLFITKGLEGHRRTRNVKLASRYRKLLRYFEDNA